MLKGYVYSLAQMNLPIEPPWKYVLISIIDAIPAGGVPALHQTITSGYIGPA